MIKFVEGENGVLYALYNISLERKRVGEWTLRIQPPDSVDFECVVRAFGAKAAADEANRIIAEFKKMFQDVG